MPDRRSRWVFDFDAAALDVAYIEGIAEVHQHAWLSLPASTELETAECPGFPSGGCPFPSAGGE